MNKANAVLIAVNLMQRLETITTCFAGHANAIIATLASRLLGAARCILDQSVANSTPMISKEINCCVLMMEMNFCRHSQSLNFEVIVIEDTREELYIHGGQSEIVCNGAYL